MQLADTRSKRRLISLTPLIDVVFILLLFFMLSTQFTRQKAMQLTVPVDRGVMTPDENASLKLRLTDRGDIMIADGETITLQSIPTHAAIQTAIEQAIPIRLDADAEVALQELVTVIDQLERAGADTINLTALR